MPALLSKSFAPALRQLNCSSLKFVRLASVSAPKPIKHVADSSEGYLTYARNISRDPNATNPQVLGDTPYTFFTRRLGHAFEGWVFKKM